VDLAFARRRSGGVRFGGHPLTRDGPSAAQKNELKPWQHKQGCLPDVSAEFGARMEAVLDLYAEPYDPKRPTVNFDETSKQLIKETRAPLPTTPGQVARYDYAYERNGTRNLFLFCEPQAGWRHIVVTAQRTMHDFAHHMQWLVDEGYPNADLIRIVLDNLNPHKLASLYETFPPHEARRIAKKLEFHYTPKHGSWLNMAELEFSVVSRQCLDRRIPDEATLLRELKAYENHRNAAKAKITWRFTSEQARVKLQRLYPTILQN
jgi:DDE superfamily endonuclease